MTDLPPGWAEARLADLVDLVRGVTYKKAQAREAPAEGYAPILRATNIEETLRLDTALVFVPIEVIKDEQWLRADDIVLAASSGSVRVVGKSARLSTDWAGSFGAFCAVVRPRPGVDPVFISHYVRSPWVRGRWSELASGTNINNLKRGHLEDTPVPVPPLPEQRRIVAAIEEHFTRIDAAEAAVDLACRRLVQLRQSAIETLFDHPEWQWTTLGEIAEVKGGVTKDSKRQSDPCFVEVPYLRVANVQRGHLDLEEVTTIRVDPNKAKSLALQPGDILFNEGGDRDKLGRGWVWEGQVPDCIHQNHVFRARLTSTDFDPHFVSTHGNTWGQRWFEENGKQTTNLASINMTTLKKFPVPAPPPEEQVKLMEELGRVQEGIGRMADQLTAAKQRAGALRQTILAGAFAGRLLPQDPEDEPAQVLLDRIAGERAGQEPGAVRGRGRVVS